jgi:hypothetical protein
MFPSENIKHCPIFWYHKYQQSIRHKRSEFNKHAVFLSISKQSKKGCYYKKYIPLSASTLNNDLSQHMKEIGINIATASKTRGASASTAFRMNNYENIDDVLHKAGWASKHTFLLHYLRLTPEPPLHIGERDWPTDRRSVMTHDNA